LLETYRVVKFMVKVKLIEKSVNSHVGRVMVAKVITQYRKLGMTWKKKENSHPIHPTMVEGVGGDDGGGGRKELEKADATEKLAAMAGAESTRDEEA
jgi:hypothetical protein